MTFQLTHNGVTDSLTGWSQRTGIRYSTLKARLLDKWPIERALETPVQAKSQNYRTGEPKPVRPKKTVKPKLIRGPKHWYDHD